MKKTAKGSVQMEIINSTIAMYRVCGAGLYLPAKSSVAYQRVREAMENKQQSIRTGTLVGLVANVADFIFIFLIETPVGRRGAGDERSETDSWGETSHPH